MFDRYRFLQKRICHIVYRIHTRANAMKSLFFFLQYMTYTNSCRAGLRFASSALLALSYTLSIQLRPFRLSPIMVSSVLMHDRISHRLHECLFSQIITRRYLHNNYRYRFIRTSDRHFIISVGLL